MTVSSNVTDRRGTLARAVARYHAGCLRVIGSQNVALRDVRTAKKAALTCDVGVLVAEETLFATRALHLCVPIPEPDLSGSPIGAAHREIASYHERLAVWERVRELAQKATLEPYAKEIAYAAPLLAGFLPRRGGRMEPVLAPLFTQSVTAVAQPDGSIFVHAQDESLRFNTALWQESTSSQNIDQIQSLGIDAQEDLAGGWDPLRVEKLLRAIHAVLPFAAEQTLTGMLQPWPERDAPIGYRRAEASLRLYEGAALFLSNKSSHYLLHDLEQMICDPTPYLDGFDDRPLSVLLSDPSPEDRPALESLTEDQVGFPFASNPAQRRVADALEKNAVVVVQGPPGTGKSLTIANLVAHFAAEGKSVLVSSHKQQALTVVRDKLNEMDMRFLYASLIGDTSHAKRELQSQIANVRAFAGTANTSLLKAQLAEIETRRAESGARYQAAREEFLRRAEPDQGEAAVLHEQFEPCPLLPIADPAVEKPEVATVAAALARLNTMAREHRPAWSQLTRSSLAASDQIEAVDPLLRLFLDYQHARGRAASDERIRALVARWHPVFDADPSQIRQAREAVVLIEETLLEPVAAVMDAGGTGERMAARSLAAVPELLDDTRSALRTLSHFFGEARRLASARALIAADPVRRAEVALHHRDLDSLVRRRGAKKWLNEYAPGAGGLDSQAVGRWCSFWAGWSALQAQATGLSSGLRVNLPGVFDPESVAVLIARVARVVSLADAITTAQTAAQKPRVALPLAEVIGAPTVSGAKEVISHWMTAITAAEADLQGDTLIRSKDLVLLRGELAAVDALLDHGQFADAEAPLTRLERVWRALPDLAERRDLLASATGHLTTSIREIEEAAAVGAPPPAFLSDAHRALTLHPSAKRFAAIASMRSTSDLAVELRLLHRQVLDDARRVLALRIQDRILAGFRKPRFLAAIEAFKRAVSTSAKRHERFENLKNSETFDVGILTAVFPCWIMRPEDACRIFPLRAGIFDVVIIDEASQCNPDQALPLFTRAKKVAVFGDQKQLTNEDLRRSLSAAANKALLRAAELEPLDPAGLFDQTRNSLLDLVSQRQQADVALNEHFRCRPEIVGFSNEQFYGSVLRVIRDRADDRGLGPALLIQEVQNPSIGVMGKVNYAEARAVVDDLGRRLNDHRYGGMSFGVLSLFREQVEHIQVLVDREIPSELKERHRLICSTVDGFQGDERDVILYSWRFAPGVSPAIFAFTNGEGGQQRVNVALTRARHQAIHFVSAPIDKFPLGAANITPYLKHSLDPARLLAAMEQRAHRAPGGEARRRVIAALRDAGFTVQEDFVACGTSIDLVAALETGVRAAVFVDAELDPYPDPAELNRIDAHSLLERAGWQVVRIPATSALPGPHKAVELVNEALASISAAYRPQVADPAYATVSVSPQKIEPWLRGLQVAIDEITPEDRADYHWEVGSVDARLHAGDTVFMSEFERELYDRLAAIEGLTCVPQWPSRGKSIDLVITDHAGRRLAVEADGEQHHETAGGALIPEDIERQRLLEAAGWVFHRVPHRVFRAQPEKEIELLLIHLREQPANTDLAARIRGDAIAQGRD